MAIRLLSDVTFFDPLNQAVRWVDREALAALGLTPELMPTFAALCGNEFCDVRGGVKEVSIKIIGKGTNYEPNHLKLQKPSNNNSMLSIPGLCLFCIFIPRVLLSTPSLILGFFISIS